MRSYSDTVTCASTHRQYPVDGQVEDLADAEQVHERPEQRRDEEGDDHEQEEVGATDQGGRRARHTDDAENLRVCDRERECGCVDAHSRCILSIPLSHKLRMQLPYFTLLSGCVCLRYAYVSNHFVSVPEFFEGCN